MPGLYKKGVAWSIVERLKEGNKRVRSPHPPPIPRTETDRQLYHVFQEFGAPSLYNGRVGYIALLTELLRLVTN